jgi:hypothetical protein
MEDIYYDVKRPGSFGGVRLLANAGKFSVQETKHWLSGIDAYTLHKPYRLRFRRRRTFAKGIDDLWQADLVDLTSLAMHNDNYKFLLVVIDVFSRYGYCVPLKSKSGATLTAAFSTLVRDKKPAMLQTDKGTEFRNTIFQKFLADNFIRFYTSENEDIKCALVERFNRTLKTRMWRYFTHASTLRYLDILEGLLEAYNSTVHSSIKMEPSSVSPQNSKEISERLYPPKKPIKTWKFEINDKVRLRQARKAFVKGYLPSWTEEIFSIKRRVPSDPPTYEIADWGNEPVRGRFYAEELQKISVKEDQTFKVDKILKTKREGGKTRYFVSWLGYPSKFNSWVDDILPR